MHQSETQGNIILFLDKESMWGTCGLISQVYPNKPNWKTEELTFQLWRHCISCECWNQNLVHDLSSGILNDRNGLWDDQWRGRPGVKAAYAACSWVVATSGKQAISWVQDCTWLEAYFSVKVLEPRVTPWVALTWHDISRAKMWMHRLNLLIPHPFRWNQTWCNANSNICVVIV